MAESDDRAARLARQLRENLKRRKAQARGLDEDQRKPSPSPITAPHAE